MVTRRRLLKSGSLAVAPFAMGSRALGYESRSILPANWDATDLHAHPGLFAARGFEHLYPGDTAVLTRLSEFASVGLRRLFCATVSDLPLLKRTAQGIAIAREFEPGEAWADYLRQINDLKALLDIWSNEKIEVVMACEGGDFLEADPARVEQAYRMGVRSIQLVHYAPNQLGDNQTQAPVFNGLSGLGREVVSEMNRLGMLIDVAHATMQTVEQVAELSTQPFMLSHSQLRSKQANHPRLLSEEHARLVASSGGVIGMWPSGYGNRSLAEFVASTLRMVEVAGIKHVGLGTDMDSNYKPVIDNYTLVPEWLAGLTRAGLPEAEVAAIAGLNATRLLAETMDNV